MMYRVAQADAGFRLVEMVENYIKMGWKVQGGVQVVNSGLYKHYQAMVK